MNCPKCLEADCLRVACQKVAAELIEDTEIRFRRDLVSDGGAGTRQPDPLAGAAVPVGGAVYPLIVAPASATRDPSGGQHPAFSYPFVSPLPLETPA